jgi:hypothetical protein
VFAKSVFVSLFGVKSVFVERIRIAVWREERIRKCSFIVIVCVFTKSLLCAWVLACVCAKSVLLTDTQEMRSGRQMGSLGEHFCSSDGGIFVFSHSTIATFPCPSNMPIFHFSTCFKYPKTSTAEKKTEETSQDGHLLVFSDCVVCAFGNRKWKSGKPEIRCTSWFFLCVDKDQTDTVRIYEALCFL